MRTSCINHPSNEPLIVIRRWQVELCEGNTTAAALLSYFEYWHNIKLEMQSRASRSNDVAEMHGDERTQDESLFQFHTEEELISGIMIAKRDTIRKALGYLSSCGFVSIHANPNPKYAFDKTRYFLFHPESINEWLNEKRSLSKPPQSKSKNRQRSSENQSQQSENQLPPSENQSAITEITPKTSAEITPETTLPPTPQGEEDEGGEDEAQAVDVEVEVVPVQPLKQAKEDNGFSEQSSSSEIPSLPQVCDNREIGEQKYKRNEARYPKNIDGSDRLPWHTREWKKFDPEFEAHMARSLSRASYYKNLPAGELLTKVRQHIWKGNFDVDRRGALELEWDAMNEAKKVPQATEMTVDQLVKRVEVQAACRGMEPSVKQQTPSPRINPQLKKEKLRLTTQLKRAKNALASKLETPFPEMYPPALIAQLQAAVEQAQRELTVFEAEMEFGF